MSDAVAGSDLRVLVERRVACPFVGSAILDGDLDVRGAPDAPVSSIDQLAALGDTGGGDLGWVLAFFARANHGVVPAAPSGAVRRVADGLFSLDFPGSQGAHPGDSAILIGDPMVVASGRFGPDDYARLTARARDGRITRSAFGAFIAENLRRDPRATVGGWRAVMALAMRFAGVAAEGVALVIAGLVRLHGRRTPGAVRSFEAALGRLLGADNLLGSAGEFGLLFALLERSPRTTRVAGQPALSTQDLDSLFVRRTLPEGWRSWRKTSGGWMWNSLRLAIDAAAAYRRSPNGGRIAG